MHIRDVRSKKLNVYTILGYYPKLWDIYDLGHLDPVTNDLSHLSNELGHLEPIANDLGYLLKDLFYM